jgi:hypothetical protein
MAQGPRAEAMSREGKGTQASSEAGRSQPLSWSEVERRVANGGWFWLATVRPDGGPHLMSVFAAWQAHRSSSPAKTGRVRAATWKLTLAA